jgi:hypothetical protein
LLKPKRELAVLQIERSIRCPPVHAESSVLSSPTTHKFHKTIEKFGFWFEIRLSLNAKLNAPS